MEEYSCYAFPALKALEALLLDLLNQKGISVNPPKQNLGSVFVPGQPQHVLSPANQAKVNDATYQKCLEDIMITSRNKDIHDSTQIKFLF